MEKIILKPAAREFLYKGNEENTYLDVSSYQGSTNQEKNLGALFVIGQIKYRDEDLSYLVSLASSLAKREYYSETSLQEQNPKEAFGRSLKKLNEVLDEFFQNKNFKLNIGLVSIVGENIFISRLGKFKINLARNNQFIDILNNVELFRMDTEREKQFSNIISGKLQAGDRLFAFFPTRSITSRERQLNDIFVGEGQEEFGRKIAQLAASVNNFSCCGAHIDMLQIKEIPFQSEPKYSVSPPLSAIPAQIEVKSSLGTSSTLPLKERRGEGPGGKELRSESKSAQEAQKVQSDEPQTAERPRIIPAELSVVKRGNIFTLAAAQLEKFRLLGRANNKAGLRTLISSAVIIMVVLTLLVSLKSTGGTQTKNALISANENLKLAQSRLGQNNIKEARSLLQAALLNISGLSDKKSGRVRDEANQILANLDRVSEKQPVVFLDLGSQMNNGQMVLITAANGVPSVVNSEGALFSAAPDRSTELGRFKTGTKFLFGTETVIAAFDGLGELAVFNLKSKNIALSSLINPLSASDAALYKDNLYALSENRIYKYTDAVTGGIRQVEWANDSSSGRLIALAVDGNIYALNDSGKLIKYFKGEKLAEFDLQVAPSNGSKIFTAKDSAFTYLADKINKKVYVFDKSNGELKISYSLSIIDKVQDIFISPDGTIWILSTDNKLWQVKP